MMTMIEPKTHQYHFETVRPQSVSQLNGDALLAMIFNWWLNFIGKMSEFWLWSFERCLTEFKAFMKPVPENQMKLCAFNWMKRKTKRREEEKNTNTENAH